MLDLSRMTIVLGRGKRSGGGNRREGNDSRAWSQRGQCGNGASGTYLNW